MPDTDYEADAEGGRRTDNDSPAANIVGRASLAVVSLVALASVGGVGAIAAPILLPLHWFAARRAGKGEHWLWCVFAGATAAEAGWAITYLAVKETGPLIWLVPLVAFTATGGAFGWVLASGSGTRPAIS
jgi:hypothetical protein